jgi:hypothetical protein
MTLARLLPLAVLSVAVAPTPGCDDPAPACACTEEFRVYTVTVLDDASQPQGGVVLTRTNLRTGRVLEPGWLGLLAPGVYEVVDDGLRDEFSSDGDIVRVTGVQSGASFTADFVFATPEPCRCHVVRIAGPDTVVIGEPPPL